MVPFEPWHLTWLVETTASAWLGKDLVYGRSLQNGGPCFTAFAGMEVVACAGVVQQWEGRAQAWSLLSVMHMTYKKSLFLAVKRFLDHYPMRRVECTVDPRSVQAKNWAKHLGFTYEGLARKYTPHGDDMELWAMVRG